MNGRASNCKAQFPSLYLGHYNNEMRTWKAYLMQTKMNKQRNKTKNKTKKRKTPAVCIVKRWLHMHTGDPSQFPQYGI